MFMDAIPSRWKPINPAQNTLPLLISVTQKQLAAQESRARNRMGL
jgi:hypothetical protein